MEYLLDGWLSLGMAWVRLGFFIALAIALGEGLVFSLSKGGDLTS
jgi:hypothetical protein